MATKIHPTNDDGADDKAGTSEKADEAVLEVPAWTNKTADPAAGAISAAVKPPAPAPPATSCSDDKNKQREEMLKMLQDTIDLVDHSKEEPFQHGSNGSVSHREYTVQWLTKPGRKDWHKGGAKSTSIDKRYRNCRQVYEAIARKYLYDEHGLDIIGENGDLANLAFRGVLVTPEVADARFLLGGVVP